MRKAKDFSRIQIKRIAEQYANTTPDFSHRYFEDEYEISQGTFYTILDKAVTECIVTDWIVRRMANKAGYNARRKGGSRAEVRSNKHYGHLWQKRKHYMLPKEEAIQVTKAYAMTKESKEDFCKRKAMTIKLLDRSILKSVLEAWVPENFVDQLRKKSFQKNAGEKTTEFWKELDFLRTKK